MSSKGFVLLEDGARFEGTLCGSASGSVGEVVFTTAMGGYQESVTDPSFAGQVLAFTAPHVGNYGVSAAAMESDRIHVRGVVMRAAENDSDAPTAAEGWLDWLASSDVPAITDVDTRALVKHLRSRGAMRGGIFAADQGEAAQLIAAEPPMDGQNLASSVGPSELVRHGESNSGPRIAAIDTGIKMSIVRQLVERGVRLDLHPCDVTAERLLADDPDAVFLANGPGDPAALDGVVETIRQVLGKKPVFGICLGHQLCCRALGLETFKLPFGHRGVNHPVKDLRSGRIEITSQNHGFAVAAPDGGLRVETDDPIRWQTDFGAAELSHVNLYDRTVEGLTLLDVPGSTVQYHPEAGPGPHDARHLFDEFVETIAQGGN
ncbi:MAG: glutamine-hydrolyzing carbamoyl-phosphate synthase small subunit [Actinobacteria bacterium]|uniref:carbamoyl-phosphate synthase (glutamine-hydrolyzing) n=1 Tax=freshwater metagenome TaxID=449393 RepID=A0A6J5ZY70_9ZZZZ|nr:glutamine-hydrolyzing carbamoyl-phosphate synthase small subunit [Actinomycetota bacterium]